MFAFVIFLGCFASIFAGERLELNDRCFSKTGPGVCVHQDHCVELKDGFYQGTYTNDDIINCGYDVTKEIICCPLEKTEIGYRPQFQQDFYQRTDATPVGHTAAKDTHEPHGTIRAAEKACQEITTGFSKGMTGIVWGYPVNNGDYPHMAALGFSTTENQAYQFLCSASLIAKKFLLTAAHCFDKPNLRPAIAVLGITSLRDTLERRKAVEARIKDVHKHPSYHSDSMAYDIAVVELFEEVHYDNDVYPICLYTDLNSPSATSDLYVTGYGAIKTKESERSEVLLKAHQTIVNGWECAGLSAESQNHDNEQICTKSSLLMEYACLGDAGGPLQLEVNHQTKQNHLVGISLSGFSCEVNRTGLYTRVTPHLSFIESIVWPY